MKRSVSTQDPGAVRKGTINYTSIFVSLSWALLQGLHHGCIVNVLWILERK